MTFSAIVREPIDPAHVLTLIGADQDGASLLFLGVVRDHNDGRSVGGVRYDTYEEMAAEVLSDIVDEAARSAGTDRVAVVHRIGELEVGEVSVAIAVSSPHRAEAYDASRYIIEEIKKRLPVWKKGALQRRCRSVGRGPDPRCGSGTPGGRIMIDQFGRRVEYLRISVTDKCNLRCVYCMPLEGLDWLKRESLLSYEEVASVVRTMAGMGLKNVRISGGEPLIRKDLSDLVRLVAEVSGIEDISLSTNAVLLADQAQDLHDAGISRVNVSLDSLQEERVEAIARRPGCFEGIMRGLEAAEAVGFDPIKINVVLIGGQNDDEIEDFALITRDRPWHVRFIELMPTGSNLDLSADNFVSCQEALARIRRMGSIEPVDGPAGNGPATYFRFPRAAGTVGVITPMSHNYCDRCNRMRLTADGQLRPCLFGSIQTNLRDPLRAGADLVPLIEETLHIKPERHYLIQGSDEGSGGLVALSQTGG